MNRPIVLDWDTRHFGFRVARAEWSGDPCELNGLLDCARVGEITLLYLFSPPDKEFPEPAGQHCVSFYPSQRVDFEKRPLSSVVLHKLDQFKIVELTWDNCDREKVHQLGVIAGKYSRFIRDPLIPAGKGEELFRIWAEESVKRKLADAAFGLIASSCELAGFVTLKRELVVARIGLLALSGEYRGCGLGKRLIQAAEHWAYSSGYNAIRVATQGENEEACSFYLRQGFGEIARKKIYHVWLESPGEVSNR